MAWYHLKDAQPRPGTLEDPGLSWSVAVIAVPGRTLTEGELGALQLSRSYHLSRPHWLRRLLRLERGTEHWLHLEIRARDGFRLRVSAKAREADAQGLPVLERAGHPVPFSILRDLFTTARALGAELASWDSQQAPPGEPLPEPPQPAPLVVPARRSAPPRPRSRELSTPIPDVEKQTPAHVHTFESLDGVRVGTPRLRHGGSISGLAISPDGERLVSTSGDCSARVWTWSEGQELGRVSRDSSGTSYTSTYSPRGDVWASAGSSTEVHLRSPQDASSQHVLQAPGNGITGLAFSPRGDRLVAIHKSTLVLWTLPEPQGTVIYDAGKAKLNSVIFTPDGESLVVGVHLYGARVIALSNGKVRARVKLEGLKSWGSVNVAVSLDGDQVAVVSHGIYLWRLGAKEPLKLSDLYGYSAVFTPDGELVVGGSELGIQSWSLAQLDAEPHKLAYGSDYVHLALSADGRRLAWATEHGVIERYDRVSEKLLPMDDAIVRRLVRVRRSRDEGHLFTASNYSTLTVWRRTKLTQVAEDVCSAVRMHSLEPSPSGRYLLSASWQALRIYTWDGKTLTRVAERRARGNYLQSAVWTPSEQVVCSFGGGSLEVLEMEGESLVERATLPPESLPCSGFSALSVGGGCLACIDAKHVELREAAQPERLLWRFPRELRLECCAMSPRGDGLATGGAGGVISLFDANAGGMLCQVKRDGAYQRITRLAWSPDGQWLGALCSAHWSLTVWRFDVGALRLVHHVQLANESPTDLDFAEDGSLVVSTSACSFVVLRDWDRRS